MFFPLPHRIFIQAYPGDGKKRRSFLPAPKKSPTSSLPPQQHFSGPSIPPGPYSGLQRAYVSKLPGAQSSSSSVSPSSSLSSISLPSSSSISSTPLPYTAASGERHGGQQRPRSYHEETRCGVGLRVGARVKIGGIKPGILRYLGTTHLAPGIFCGIELLEALGTHDGEVNGHRYFHCPPNCGIFAPKEKVCIDASARSRVSSESDGNLYSSNESLTERTYKAFRSFEEGELEAVDCSILSPDSPHGETGKRKRPDFDTPPDWGSRSTDSIDSQDSSYFQGKPKSRLPRSGRGGSSIPSPHGQPLKSPGTTDPSYSFGFQSALEDIHPSGRSGKLGYEHRVRDVQYQDRGRTSSKPQSSRSNNSHYLNYAFDPAHLETQEILHKDLAEGKDSHRSRFFNQPEKTSSSTRDPRLTKYQGVLDSTFESPRSPSPSSQPANRTFDIVEVSPSPPSAREDRDGLPLTSTPEPGHHASRFESGPTLKIDQASSGPSSSFSGSETDSDDRGHRLSETYSLSDFQASKTLGYEEESTLDSQQVNVSVGDGTPSNGIGTGSARVHSGACQQGGYASSDPSRCGDGNSRGLFPSQPHAPSSSRKSASYIVSSQGDEQSHDVNKSLSYTVCAGQKDSVLNPDDGLSTDSSGISGEIAVVQKEQPCKIDAEKERQATPLQDGKTARNSPPSTSNAPQSVSSVVVAAAASLSYTVCRSHSPSPCGRKVSSGGSSHEENGESSSSSGPPSSGGGDHRQDHLDDSSTGVSPEVSQALEWDYGQEFIDGKIPPPLSRHHLHRHARNHSSSDAATIMTTSSSTGTSESLSDALSRDVSSEPSSDTEMTPASSCSLADDSDQFEAPENDFENIDSLEDLDFPMLGKIGVIPSTSASTAGVSVSVATAVEMIAPPTTVMTDSGISERDESEMFKSTTSATSTSTLCGGGAGDNSFSDDCSREDDHSSSSILAGNAIVSSSTTLSTSSATSTKNATSSDSSQETICVADTPGSIEDKEFLSEDGEVETETARLKCLQRVKADTDGKRQREDSTGEDADPVSGSPVSVVSLEDVSLIQDRTVTCGTPPKEITNEDEDTSSLATESPEKAADSSNPQGIPWRETADTTGGVELDLRDSAGLLSTRRERPVSLLSTTSADTGTKSNPPGQACLPAASPCTEYLYRSPS